MTGDFKYSLKYVYHEYFLGYISPFYIHTMLKIASQFLWEIFTYNFACVYIEFIVYLKKTNLLQYYIL